MQLCECGCGQQTTIATKTDRTKGHTKGEPFRFLPSHSVLALAKVQLGADHPNWKGGKNLMTNGYVRVNAPHHPKADCGMVCEHILLAEKALGRYLPKGVQVHHHNEIRSDNGPGNLVLCQDIGYHKLLHKRMRAIRRTGNVNG